MGARSRAAMAEKTLEEKFTEASTVTMKTWTPAKTVPNDRKLILYGFFKQIKEGDVSGERPGMFSWEAKQKWDAWKKCEGMSKEECMKGYVEEMEKQVADFS